MERKPSKHARRTRSTGGGVLASFLRSISSTSAARGKSSFNHRNAFSGPMVSIVPPEARGAGGGGGRRRGRWQGGGHRTPEPTSPKVSCIGQIKRSKSNKSKKCKARMMAAMKVPACGTDGGACPLPPRPPVAASRPKGSSPSLVKRMLFRRSKSRSSSSKSSGKPGCSASVAAAPAPPVAGLGQMKRFTSGRGAFEDFDWTADQTERRGSDFDGGDDGYDSYEDDGFVAHSAPLVLGGGMVASEPRKEVNLWRRRPMSSPTPLQLP